VELINVAGTIVEEGRGGRAGWLALLVIAGGTCDVGGVGRDGRGRGAEAVVVVVIVVVEVIADMEEEDWAEGGGIGAAVVYGWVCCWYADW